jgi:hypothetical protein
MNIWTHIVGLFTIVGLAAGCSSLPINDDKPVSDAGSADVAVSTPEADAGIVICELAGRDSIVRVLASDSGTRYTLCDERGSVIAANLDCERLAAIRPDLDPRHMQADGSFELMLTDPID